MKALIKFYVIALIAITSSFLVGCSSSKNAQSASKSVASGEKNFFESYGYTSEGTYVKGRVVFAEAKSHEIDGIATYVELDSGQKFTMIRSKDNNISPFFIRRDKRISKGEDDFDLEEVLGFYVEAIVKDGFSDNYFYCDANDFMEAQNFIKHGTKKPTEVSSLDIKDYKWHKNSGGPRSSGKSQVMAAVVLYRGIGTSYHYYLENGEVLSLWMVTKDSWTTRSYDRRKVLEKGDIVSYILSDMTGKNAKNGKDPFTNVLDYIVD